MKKWWNEIKIKCKNKEDFEFWNDTIRTIKILREKLNNDRDVLRIIQELVYATTKIEDEKIISVNLSADEIIRAINRELRLKEERLRHKRVFGRGLGGRKSKIEKYVFYYKNAKTDKEREEILREAKRKLSRTSFWRLKKAIRSIE